MILSQIINALSLPREAILIGEAVLEFELNQICLALTYEDLNAIDLNHALLVAPVDLFDSDQALEHFDSLAKNDKVIECLAVKLNL